jgi:hypothetical protein
MKKSTKPAKSVEVNASNYSSQNSSLTVMAISHLHV